MTYVIGLITLANLSMGLLFLLSAIQEYMEDDSSWIYGLWFATIFLCSGTLLLSGTMG